VRVNEDANTVVNHEDSLAPMLGLGKDKIIHVYEVQSYCALNAGMYSKGQPIYMRARERQVAAKPIFEQEPYAQVVYMVPVIAWVRLGKWDDILQSAPPGSRWSYAQAIDHFAKGMANTRHKNLAAAKADLDSLEENLHDPLLDIRIMPFDKPVDCGRIAAGILKAEILVAEGKQDQAIAVYNATVAKEDALMLTEVEVFCSTDIVLEL